jgi:hypothetical protein
MNEFVARNGLIALDSSSISGPFVVTGSTSILGQLYVNNGGAIGQVIQAVNHVGGTSYIYLQAGGSDSYISSTGTNSFSILNSTRIGLGSSLADTPWLGMTSTGTYIGFNSHVSPSARLHIKGATTGSALTLLTQNSNDSASFAVKDDGNIGIGTTSPTARLDVRGNTFLSGSVTGSDMLIRGSGNTSGTNVLRLQNSDGSGLLTINNVGATTFAGSVILTNIFGNGGNVTIEPGNSATRIVLKTFANATSYVHVNGTATFTHTAADVSSMVFDQGYAPTSGTGLQTNIKIIPTINQTGGANGITRGLYIAPTLTAAADWRSIQWDNNSATAPSASWGLYGAGTAPNYINGNLGIGTTSPTYRLDINGSFRSSGSITATSGSDYFDISHDITQPAQTGSQVYEVNITPTLRYTAPNQTQTALRVAATFSGSTALSSSQSNIIADFGSTSAGSQFLVNDVTSGSIYMVNDVSGLPIIEANSNWDVMIYDYPNVVLRKTGSAIIISGSLTIASGSNNDLYMYGHKMFSVGAFQSDQTQSGSANVSQSITYNTIDYSQGVSVVSGSRLTVANAGVYNIQFSVQVDRTSGSGVDTIHIWLKKNGTNVTNSSGTITISGIASQAKTVSSWNYVVDSAANDYYELCWQTTDTNIQLINVVATGNIPGTPSVIVTVTQVR